ncbi:MAG: class II aldolase/adducin family protein [Salibacteraceae bacterium]
MFKRGWIGYDSLHKVGFGNVSLRTSEQRIFISGTQTGHHTWLTAAHLCEVLAARPEQNHVKCLGPLPASSETMTHMTLYDLHPTIKAVLHIHEQTMWKMGLSQLPQTGGRVPYGTPEMANEIRRVYNDQAWQDQGLLVMAGHEDGILAFGPDLATATRLLLDWENQSVE